MEQQFAGWRKKFFVIWTGQGISTLTSSIVQMAIIWYITGKTKSAAVLSFATLAGFLPQAVLGMFIGVLIDQHDRKKIMICSDLVMSSACVALAVSGIWGDIPIWLIFIVLFVRSIGNAFYAPSLQAIMPSILPKDQLTKYAGYSQSFESASMIASPAIAAVLYSMFPLKAILMLDVLGAFFAVGTLAAAAADTTAAAADSSAAADAATEAAKAATGEGKKVGVAMPTQSSERWINDGANMKKQLEALGYEVDLQYAEDDVQMQVSQIENMIASGVNCLVIASIDSSALVNVEEQAKNAGIPIIAYDRLLMDTDAVSYYATFDNKGVGTAIGNYIKEAKDLDAAKAAGESYTIEFFMGSPDDNNALFLYNGLMEVLQPYLDDGTLVCKSGRTSFEDTCILRWSQETAQQNCENYLTGFYADEKLDICASAFDGFAYGCKAALEGAGYKVGEDWPLITGQDAELMAVKNIISGYQTATIYKDTRLLAEKCVTMVQAVLEGAEPEINDTEQYNNGKVVVPAYLCTPVAVDKDNYKEIIVDGGYYTEEQLAQ